MIYLIGGAPRVGKSQLMQKVIAHKPMPSFSCDFLYDLDQVKNIQGFSGANILEKGRLFYPTLLELLLNISLRSEDAVIEGEVILPEFIPELSKKYSIKSCFLGLSHTDLTTIITNGGYFNWPKYKIEHNLASEVKTLAENTVSRSMLIEHEANKYNLPYYDLANNYDEALERAMASLLAE